MRAVRCSRRGFALIELLVVIFILGLLISIMLPTLCRSREQRNRVKCASNLSACSAPRPACWPSS